MNFTAPTESATRHFLNDGMAAHSIADQIVEARRCTVQMQNGFLYLDALASPATALLGYDRPAPEAIDKRGLMRTLSKLHREYKCVALDTGAEAMVPIAKQIAATIGGNGQGPRVVNAAAGEPEFIGGITIALEDETIGRSGAWLVSPAWRSKPDLIVLGSTLAAGESFGALLMSRRAVERGSSNLQIRAASVPAGIMALVQGVVVSVERQQLIEHGRDLAKYFSERMNAVQAACQQIAAIRFGVLSANVRFQPGTSAGQLKRKLCERGLLVGADEQNGLVIRPPLSTRPAEIDVISGVLRGVMHGVPATRISACCAACQDQAS